MAKERKSPQEKKELEYTRDHFTGGWHSSRMFPRTWRRKKARANRQYRRRSEELLAPAKPGMAADDMDSIAEDLTAARFQKSVGRKRLHKVGTVTVGEKVKRKLERREEAIGRNVRRHAQYDRAAAEAVGTLSSLGDENLVSVVHRADLLCSRRNADELKRVLQSEARVDRALHFLYLISAGSAFEADALRRNPELDKSLSAWLGKARRILAKGVRKEQRRRDEKEAVRKKLKALRQR